MARIAGVDLPRNKKIEFALQYIYGIGPHKAKEILDDSSVNPDTRVNKLSEEQVISIRNDSLFISFAISLINSGVFFVGVDNISLGYITICFVSI